jgi:hypothetical protein
MAILAKTAKNTDGTVMICSGRRQKEMDIATWQSAIISAPGTKIVVMRTSGSNNIIDWCNTQ